MQCLLIVISGSMRVFANCFSINISISVGKNYSFSNYHTCRKHMLSREMSFVPSYLKYNSRRLLSIEAPQVSKIATEKIYHFRITKITLQNILNNNHIEYEFCCLKILWRHIAQFRLLNEHVIFLIVLTCTTAYFFFIRD